MTYRSHCRLYCNGGFKMQVSAKADRVHELINAARTRIDIIHARGRQPKASDVETIERTQQQLDDAGMTETILVDDADLRRLRELSEELSRIEARPLARWLRVYVVACYLFSGLSVVVAGFNAIFVALTAPVSVPIILIELVIGASLPPDSEFPITAALAVPVVLVYVLLLIPAYGIAENIRYREFSRWPYVTTGIVYCAAAIWFFFG